MSRRGAHFQWIVCVRPVGSQIPGALSAIRRLCACLSRFIWKESSVSRRKLIALTHLMSPGGISPDDAGSLSKKLVLRPFSGARTSGASKPNETSQSRLVRYGNGRTRSRLDVVGSCGKNSWDRVSSWARRRDHRIWNLRSNVREAARYTSLR